MARSEKADQFLDLIGASLGAKLSAECGDPETAVARLGRVLETASSLRSELVERELDAAGVDGQ